MTKLNFLRDNVYNKETGKKVFDDTIQFPTEFTLKVIGPNDAKFVDDIVNVAATTLSVSKETIKTATKETMGGKYVSVTLVPYFNSAEELYRCYDVISKDKRVKFCL
jgi:putative lipoic acid-binding regulatory protein